MGHLAASEDTGDHLYASLDGGAEDACAEALEAALAGDYGRKPTGGSRLDRAVARVIELLDANSQRQLDRMVELSITANRSAICGATALKSSKQTQEGASGIAAAAEELAASIAEISDSAKSARTVSETTKIATVQGQESAAKAAETMTEISETVESAAAQVNNLAEASTQIGEIVNSIEQIAQQTNLLALNATIEAARAGEAGKGFAVVASEVKSLSQQTAKATEDIRQRIENLQSEMQAIVDAMARGADVVSQGQEVIVSVRGDMNGIAEHAQSVEERMREIEHVLSQQSGATREVTSAIDRINVLAGESVAAAEENAGSLDAAVALVAKELAVLAELNIPHKIIFLAKADHVIWMKRLADMFAGRIALSDDELASHEHCRLGKWYYSDRAAAYRDAPAFAELEAPHREVHRNGIDAVAAYNRGDLDGAMAALRRTQDASVDVLRLLDALKA